MKEKKIFVLVGPPSVGKSTWIKSTFTHIDPYIINRDDLVEKVAEEYGWTYDDLFVTPLVDSKLGDISEKYGEVVKSPDYMTWAPLSYDKILEANTKVADLFSKKVSEAKGQDNIVVDMTNMNVGSRKGALKPIEGSEDEYKKVAVVFNFKGAEDIIKKVAMKRAEEAKAMGKSKTIPQAAFDRMFSSFQEISPEEGFDEVINVDNTSKLKELIGESMRYLRTYEGFLDFFKKKEKKEPVQFDDLMECLYDLTDESRIKNRLTSDAYWLTVDTRFVDEDIVFNKKPSLSLDDDYDAFMNDELYSDKKFKFRKNSIAFNISYNPKKISDDEVNEILLDCKSKLDIYGCKTTFFIAWMWNMVRNNDAGNITKSQSNKEWGDFMKMIDKSLPKVGYSHKQAIDADRNITIKIESPSGFN
jgi:hypothetical protein